MHPLLSFLALLYVLALMAACTEPTRKAPASPTTLAQTATAGGG